MKICMAAPYDVTDPRSWSGTPYSLYRTLCETDNEITTLDLSAYHTKAAQRRSTLRYLDVAASLKARTPVSKIGMSAMNPLNSSILHAHCRKGDCDVLLELGGFLPGKDLPPYYIYTDASHDLSLDFYREQGRLPFGYEDDDLEAVKRAAAFSRAIYQNAQGVFCMSRWLADSMVRTTGIPEKRVHVVYAGSNWHGGGAALSDVKIRQRTNGDEIRMLLTGVDFKRKGIDLAIEATDLLNREGVRCRLHICGIRDSFPHSEYVVSHGRVDKAKLTELLQQCDLFVLPSRFDCFGIAFTEAMAFGLPCIGRRICAMPEIIDEGENGELVTTDDPRELADKIVSVCGDAEKYARYSASAIRKAQQFTWENTVQRMLRVLENDRG